MIVGVRWRIPSDYVLVGWMLVRLVETLDRFSSCVPRSAFYNHRANQIARITDLYQASECSVLYGDSLSGSERHRFGEGVSGPSSGLANSGKSRVVTRRSKDD